MVLLLRLPFPFIIITTIAASARPLVDTAKKNGPGGEWLKQLVPC
jgi:hypothetical protein